MAKTDIKSAFRIIPVHPKDHPLLGMKWDSQYFFDRTLSMGCSSSCAIFEAFSSTLEWLSKHLFHASSVVHILDDFLFIAPTRERGPSFRGLSFRVSCLIEATAISLKHKYLAPLWLLPMNIK